MNCKKKIRRYSVYILSILLAGCSMSACRLITATSTPIPLPSSLRFVNHLPPQGDTDFQTFDDRGCPPDEYDFRKCKEDSPLFALGCDEIQESSNLLGSLEPAYPIALCVTELQNLSGEISEVDEAYQRQCEISPTAICANIENILGSVLILTIVSIVLLLLLIILFPGTASLKNIPGLSEWYLYIGGVLGVAILAAPIFLIPRLGATSTLTALVIGQLGLALISDHFGLFGFPKIEVNLMRIIGIIFLAAGVFVIRQ